MVGGRSTEHDTSIHSYTHVLAQVLADTESPLAIAGVYYVNFEHGVHAHRSLPWPRSAAELATPVAEPLLRVVAELAQSQWPVFSLLHGTEGEDGAWQGLAEVAGLRGSFGPVLGSALAMSKFHMATIATALAPVRMPRTALLDDASTDADLIRAIGMLGARPAVVKPNSMGSSLLTGRHDPLDLMTLRRLRQKLLPYDSQVLVQEYIRGEEYTAGCLEMGGEVIVLPVVKAVTPGGFLGHAEKHTRGLVHPELVGDNTDIAARIKGISKTLFRQCGFLGMCRFDYLVDNDNELFFLEANTLPGLARGSAYTLMLSAAGYSMVDVIIACVRAASVRPQRRKLLRYEVDD
ncbi:MAG: D-alanine--D-alanine ligase family protein [Acetobacteraceae bacterium]